EQARPPAGAPRRAYRSPGRAGAWPRHARLALYAQPRPRRSRSSPDSRANSARARTCGSIRPRSERDDASRGLVHRSAVASTRTPPFAPARPGPGRHHGESSRRTLDDQRHPGGIPLQADHIPVPPGVVAVLPDQGGTIPYTVHRLVERHLPVHLEYIGDARITQVKIDPPTVVVRGPKDIVDRMWTINTQACALPAPPENLDSK